MSEHMAKKYGLTAVTEGKDTFMQGKVFGIDIRIVNGKHNNRNYRKVLCHDDSILFDPSKG